MKITKEQLKEIIKEVVLKELEVEEPSFIPVLKLASRASHGVGFTIPRDWAKEIIEYYQLKPQTRRGDMSGEVSALFDYNGTTLRLKKEFPNRWKVYNGDWKSDPRWTGD